MAGRAFVDITLLTEQQRDDMRMAFNVCRDGEMPDRLHGLNGQDVLNLQNWERGFYDLALYALDRIAARFTVQLEILVNNWNHVNFQEIFDELEELVGDHPVSFRELLRDTTIAAVETSSDEDE